MDSNLDNSKNDAFLKDSAVLGDAGDDKITNDMRSISINPELSRKEVADALTASGVNVERNQRRKCSILQMGVTEDVRNIVLTAIPTSPTSTDEKSSVEKMQVVLTAAKEKGMSAEKIFGHFGPNEAKLITFDSFKEALNRLVIMPKNKLSDDDLDQLCNRFESEETKEHIDFLQFMEFCMAIPTLPWKAEKTRRLSNYENGALFDAARNCERKRGVLKAVDIGEKLYEGKKFFWRVHKNLDIVVHENKSEGLIIVNSRIFETEEVLGPIFVDHSAACPTKAQLMKQMETKLATNPEFASKASDPKVKSEALEASRRELIVEFVTSRLQPPEEKLPIELASSSNSCTDESIQRFPTLQPTSTDSANFNPICTGFRLSSPYQFPVIQKVNAEKFRRASITLKSMTAETNGLVKAAEVKSQETTKSVSIARKLTSNFFSKSRGDT